MLASSVDGTGGDGFYRQVAEYENIADSMNEIMSHGRNETVPDQWEAQILLRILMHATVIYISDADDDTIRRMHMIPAHSIDEALEKAKQILGKSNITITAIPDGVAVMVRK